MVLMQPPPGGCVLKLKEGGVSNYGTYAATSGWLCVETLMIDDERARKQRSHLRVAVC